MLIGQDYLCVIHLGNVSLLGHYNWPQEGKEKLHNIIISMAFKWMQILFRRWKTHTPYDESTYLTALKSKSSPLLKFAVESEL
ncbi:hypothetical protein [Pseudoalteromonas fuliginea]|uniref:hypothetical protein n=1 Tax=Pseudoalteromonas fuliginea TaxID=1872678 RepID=UPI00317B9CD2